MFGGRASRFGFLGVSGAFAPSVNGREDAVHIRFMEANGRQDSKLTAVSHEFQRVKNRSSL
jgi:hypothetical protein